ncbi:hypothetical protein BZG36_04934 [Bifiguratus adelaidae]|uniref:GlcNAc-PI synthesis protein n=1 Tax=Bifiguratus adelaidae TaxID=1938954 RepID=A0A261XX25_9FUNG|nr:hypothetical protein BZG36_04934 [Bifiguratus adelaidae]
MGDLTALRHKIDSLDVSIIHLLNERAQVSVDIGAAKKALDAVEIGRQLVWNDFRSSRVHSHARKANLRNGNRKVSRLNKGPLKDESLNAIFREIMSASISLQKELKVGYLGPAGSFSHQAAIERFGDSVLYIPQEQIKDVFTLVEKGRATYGIVPFENSTHGSVVQTLDRLMDTNLKIRAESYLTIHQCLLSNSPLKSIKRIYSHPQGFGQSQKWLDAHLPNAERINVSSTSLAAEIAARETGSAAICSETCASLYGLDILERDIEDLKTNTTRFFVLGTSSDKPTSDDKLLVRFTVDHRQPGALCDGLKVFKDHNINLTKIDSRPSRERPWHYVFYVECQGGKEVDEEAIQAAVQELSKYCLEVCVIIITHAYGHRAGVRYVTNGLKVYYVPMGIVYSQASFPTIFGFFPIFRAIVIREEIDIVHGHQAFSSMCLEGILHGRTMGLKACFTDHSLFGFADASSILTNKLLKWTLSDIDHVICVSNTRQVCNCLSVLFLTVFLERSVPTHSISKENTVLRAALNPQHVSVIPNAIVASQFKPDTSKRDPTKITIVVISRLVYRKGIDLLIAVIPRICAMHQRARFINGGDGPKRIDLEQMREKYLLHDRVELLGPVKHHDVVKVLNQGDIFLNTSLTEAFCIAIVEAASCGLLVVSTKVGGVPEVLPRHMINFSKPEEDDLVVAVSKAIHLIRSREVNPVTFHEELKEMYSWSNVAERTEKVYDEITRSPTPPLIERLRRYYGCGVFAGKIFCLVMAIDYLIWMFLEWLFPKEEVEIAQTVDYATWRRMGGNNISLVPRKGPVMQRGKESFPYGTERGFRGRGRGRGRGQGYRGGYFRGGRGRNGGFGARQGQHGEEGYYKPSFIEDPWQHLFPPGYTERNVPVERPVDDLSTTVEVNTEANNM